MQAPSGARAEFVPRRCPRFEQGPLPVLACSSGLLVSTSAEAAFFGQPFPESEAAARSPGEALDSVREPAFCCGQVRDFPGELSEPDALAD
ncbi:MAG TPA: hypothetical protein VFP99_04200 [Chthoniobacterales bacterium]|nr:hypothetical protein [Chthoniobacterales bacterium]